MSLRRPRRFGLPVLVLSVTLVAALPGLAATTESYDRPAVTERVAQTPSGEPADYSSTEPDVSADGRWVLFRSRARMLVDPPLEGVAERMFLRDRLTGVTHFIGGGSLPRISGDGRYVAFRSQTRYDPTHTGVNSQLYLWDREAGGTPELISRADGPDGPAADQTVISYDMSPDARFFAFEVRSNNLADTTSSWPKVFVRDRVERTTQHVSVNSDGVQGDHRHHDPTISADGNVIAFQSYSRNLIEDDTNERPDVFAHNRATGETVRVSEPPDGREPNEQSWLPSVSGDGRYVAFVSAATNLVPGDTNANFHGNSANYGDVFVRDLQTGRMERVSVGSAGEEADGRSTNPKISLDGRHVAFQSMAPNLTTGREHSSPYYEMPTDVYVYDRHARRLELISADPDGAPGDGSSANPSISADGQVVAFETRADSLLPGQPYVWPEVVARDRGSDAGSAWLDQDAQDGQTIVSGQLLYPTPVLASRTGSSGAGTAASELGARVDSADVRYRLERADLFFSIRLEQLLALYRPDYTEIGPLGERFYGMPEGAGPPNIVYGATFRVDGERFEARMERFSPGHDPEGVGHPEREAFIRGDIGVAMSLHRCPTAGCILDGYYPAGYGSTGHEVTFAVPLADLGLAPGDTITDLTITSAHGFAPVGRAVVIHSLVMPDLTIPQPEVRLAVAPSGTPAADADFSITPSLEQGAFTASVPTDGLSELTDYDLYTRVCLASSCGVTSAALAWE